MSVYITSTGRFLPGPPIDNESIESHLGLINGNPSRLKKRILKSNGITTRHYAIDTKHNTVFNNSDMAARASENCLNDAPVTKQQLTLLSCATSQGDSVLPGFGSEVQASLELPDIELHTTHGICSCSMMALKHAFLNIKANEHSNALVVASELTSRLFKASRYEAVSNGNGVDFDAEFLRWMLSDGAGALLLESKPRNTCFRIEWIKGFSHADAYPICMSIGHPSSAHDSRTWQDFATYAEAEKSGALLIRQDVRLLENMVKIGVDGFLRCMETYQISANEIDHVLCHYSSDFFKSRIFTMLAAAGVAIAEEKWYTNLYTRGNTGCAAIFIMLDEFRRTQSYKVGDKIFCMVPESGRFNTTYMLLSVVEA